MSVTYKVLVIRQESPRRALLSTGPSPALVETLFEAGGPDAGRLLAYAPAEVAAALSAAGYAEAPQRVTGLVDVDALAAATLATGGIVPPSAAPIVVGEPDVPAATNGEPAEAPATDDKPKRKRRTKAEIEADKARAAAGGNAFGEQVVADTEAQQAPAGVTVTTTFAGAAPVPPVVATPAPVEQPAAAPTEPAAPYNPFA